MSARRLRIGVDLGGTKVEALALGADGAERVRRRVETPADDYPAVLRAVADLVAAVEREALDADHAPAIGIGVGGPGALSPATGRIKNANSTCLNGEALGQDLERAIGRPVRLANDADCFALSEAVDGAGAGARVVFGVIAGTGVGGGIVVDGRALRGPNAIAGEWGHTPLPAPNAGEIPGPLCYCGRRGCVETWISGPGLAAEFARETGREGLSAADLAAAAAAGDEAARAALARHADRFGRALAQVVNILDPDVIVLGGGLSNIPDLPQALMATMTPHVFSDRVDTRIVRNIHGDSSGVRGAAWLWSQETARAEAGQEEEP